MQYTPAFHPRIILCFLITFGILLSCEFDTEEVNFQEIEDMGVEYPRVLLDFSDSLVVIYDKTTFHYEVHLDSQLLHETEFFLDGKKIHSKRGRTGEFTINPADGVHELEMTIHTSSGSGTIRNKLGGEHWLFSKSWTLVMEKPGSKSVKFTNAGIVGGQLVFEWETYDSYRFDYYEIISVENYNRYRITDVNSCFFREPYFVGGKETYLLSIRRKDNVVIPCDTVTISISYPLSYSIDENYNLTFTWPACKVEDNFQSYHLYRGNSSFSENRIFYSNDVLDTTFTMQYGLGQDRNYVLTIYSTEHSNGAGDYETIKTVQAGTKIEGFASITQTMFPPYLVYTNAYIYDPVNQEKKSYSNPYPSSTFGISPDNRLLFSRRTLMEPAGTGKWRKLNNLHEDYPVSSGSRVSLALGDIGIIEGMHADYMYNFRTDSIWHYLYPNSWAGYLFSPNAKHYIAFNDGQIRVYTVEGKVLEFKGGITYSEAYDSHDRCHYEFMPDSLQSRLIFVADGKLQLWSCDQIELVQETQTEADILVQVDPVSKTVLCHTDYKYFVYDMDSFELLKEVRVDGQFGRIPDFSNSNIAYMGGIVYLKGSPGAYSFRIL
jgi:hypothetical protein